MRKETEYDIAMLFIAGLFTVAVIFGIKEHCRLKALQVRELELRQEVGE